MNASRLQLPPVATGDPDNSPRKSTNDLVLPPSPSKGRTKIAPSSQTATPQPSKDVPKPCVDFDIDIEKGKDQPSDMTLPEDPELPAVDVDEAGAAWQTEMTVEELRAEVDRKQSEQLNQLLTNIVESVPGLLAAELFLEGIREDNGTETTFSPSKARTTFSPTKQTPSPTAGQTSPSSKKSPTKSYAAATKVLARPDGGWFCRVSEDGAIGHFKQLGDGSADIGTSFAGVLWAEAATDSTCHWRTLTAMADDPEIPYDDRTHAAARAFGSVGAVALPRGVGLLLLYTSHAAVSSRMLKNRAVLKFIRVSAVNVGTFVDVQQPRRTLAGLTEGAEQEILDRWAHLVGGYMEAKGVKTSIMDILTGDLGTSVTLKRESACYKMWVRVKNHPFLNRYVKKCKGAGGKVPPRSDWKFTAWTFGGVFLTLMIMSALNKFVVTELSEGEFFIMLGSYGALLTLLFGAPASPLCQPRNVFLGTTYSAAVAVVVRYLSAEEYLDVLPPWIAAALVPAIAIAGMAKLGVLHPPAGAASLIFISGGPKVTDLGFWYLLIPLLVGNIICVAMATLFNNLNEKRQYPLFW